METTDDKADWLDARLREEIVYIDDAGFTQRVLKQLPAARQRHRSLRAIILLGISILASALAYFVFDAGDFVRAIFLRVSALPFLYVFLFALCSGVLVTGISCAAAMSKVWHSRS